MASRLFWKDHRAVAAMSVGAMSVGLIATNHSENDANEEEKENNNSTIFAGSISSWMDPIAITKTNHHSIFHTNFSSTSMERSDLPPSLSPARTEKTREAPSKILHYDFVILGNGNAGRSALETLQKQCPSAKIAIVDPLQSSSSTTAKSVDFFRQAAITFQPYTKTVKLSGDEDSGTIQLNYRHAILVATGSRAAPPPLSLIDEGALDRVLELRPTECLDKYKVNTGIHRPVLPAQTIRDIVQMASAEGNTIGILGSGWEAIELAAFAAHHAGKKNKPVLTFGSAGPLSHILPRYLSTAVTRRLRQCGVEVQERSLVRYIADLNYVSPKPQLELHTAKSYDLMDTQRTMIDCLVVAPYIDGSRGTALLPTTNAPPEIQEFTNNHTTWYSTWSQLTCPTSTDPSMVVCYADDGRIAVNAELSAASNVYAAGSVAKYPNSKTGHAHVAGEGSIDGAMAGHLAALRMSQEYSERTKRTTNSIRHGLPMNNNATPLLFASSSFPIWRSDMCSYLPPKNADSPSLSSIGVRALCIGKCDSEGMATHGYWWTNVSIKKRYTKLAAYTTPSAATKGKNNRDGRNNNGAGNNRSRPVYGAGVVYYLDRTGKISGIMIWGLPFTTMTENGEQQVLNDRLVKRMKDVILSDGNVTVSDFSSQLVGKEDLEDALLQSDHLAEESRHLATIALEGLSSSSASLDTSTETDKNQRILEQIQIKPLYRYTAAKPPSITSIGMLRRKDQTGGGELIGENIYVQNDECENMMDMAEQRPQSLVYVYPMDNFTSTSLVDSFLHDSFQDRMVRSLDENETRSRPPKEEPIWLRRGEEARMTNRRQTYANLVESNMKRGQFSDGTDAVKQAPVPQIIQKFKTKVKGFLGNTEEQNSDVDADTSVTNSGDNTTVTDMQTNDDNSNDTKNN